MEMTPFEQGRRSRIFSNPFVTGSDEFKLYNLGWQRSKEEEASSKIELFVQEHSKAREKFSAMASAHEGYAVILEELDEVWDIVKQKQSERDYRKLRKEVIQLGAMVYAFLIEIVDAENRR